MFGKKTPGAEDLGKLRTYDYRTPEARVATAQWLFAGAKGKRSAQEREWVRYNDYYNFIHGVSDEVRDYCRENGIPWDTAVVPDPFIMVESQIDPKIPEPEFRGRDDDMDSVKAKQREFAVKYLLQENRLEDRNTANERRLKKLGDSFWKAYWDPEMPCGPYEGNVRIQDVPVEDLYVDPTAGDEGLQSAQYVDYVYRLHKVRFRQRYARDLEKLGIGLDELLTGDYRDKGGLFDLISATGEDDTVQVLEHWYKQPYDTREAPAGSVACSLQAGGREIRHIPNYWQRTGPQHQLFPFVHTWCVRDENQFYNKSELLPILTLVDGADRELANAQLNDALMANDIILAEEDALADGEELTNEPGALVRLKRNAMGKVQRLGGLHNGIQSVNMVNWYLEQVQRANRNYDANLGKETAKVTTASGLMQIRSDADSQSQLKKADRNRGFARLYELLDWLALEFFDDNRLLFLGAKDERDEPKTLRFQGEDHALTVPAVLDAVTGETVREEYAYYPRVDVTVSAGDGVARSKAATLETLDKLSAIQPTPQNYKILAAELEILDIPQKQEIVQCWEEQFSPAVPPEVVQALGQDPELLGLVEQAILAKQGAGGEAFAGGEAVPPVPSGIPQEGGDL